jgi:hypothetical protein
MRDYSAIEQGAPWWLLQHPGVPNVLPPGRCTLHELPLDKLHWEDFERLCWRLVALEAEVSQVCLYGERGQAQEGIDLYAELRDNSRAVYQCRRVKSLSEAGIRGAVDDFLDRKWADRAQTFCFCTSRSLRDTKLADTIAEETARLRDLGITFERLDLDEISRRCKTQPEIVWDFFGKAWANAFCGPELAERAQHRLTPDEARSLREQLRALYNDTFAEHDTDSCLSAESKQDAIRLAYVVPNLIQVEAAPRHRTSSVVAARRGLDDADSVPGSPLPTPSSSSVEPGGAPAEVCRDPQAWLAGGRTRIVVGGPGSGKSSLLRFIACDLLSAKPRFKRLSAHLAGFIPIWIPFPYWVARLTESTSSTPSLLDVIGDWLRQRDMEGLAPLLSRAFEDGRMVWLVDGLDEYLDLEAAQRALKRLVVARKRHEVPLIGAGRPVQTARLRPSPTGWSFSMIAELDRAQMEELLERRSSLESATDADPRQSMPEISAFFHALDRNPAARRLAGSPLLLVLLHRIWTDKHLLPANRTDLLGRAVAQAVQVHPSSRRIASEVRKPEWLPDDEGILDSLSHLALSMRASGLSLTTQEALIALRSFFEGALNRPGLRPLEAPCRPSDLLWWFVDHIGVLQSDADHLRFRHRAILEHLAARRIVSLPADERRELIRTHAWDPSWQEVWPDLIAQAKSVQMASQVFELLLESKRQNPSAFHLDLSLTAAAVGGGLLPQALRLNHIDEIASAIRQQAWWPHRPELVRIVVTGLLHPDTACMVNGLLEQWIPGRAYWSSAIIEALGRWEPTPQVQDVLLTSLQNRDDDHARLEAARVLVRIARGDPPAPLIQLARASTDPDTRAAAILALAEGWPEHPQMEEITAQAPDASSPSIAVCRQLSRLRRGEALDIGVDALHLTSNRQGLSGAFQPVLREVLVGAWAGDVSVRDELLKMLSSSEGMRWKRLHSGRHEVDLDAVTEVLVRAFPGDDAVAAWLEEEFTHHSRFHGRGIWSFLMTGYRRHPRLQARLDMLLESRALDLHPDRAYAAVTSGSERAKALLIQDLDRNDTPWWAAWALIEGWSQQEADVSSALQAFIETDQASSLGHLLPDLLEPDQARARLLHMLAQPSCYRDDNVISGLAKLCEHERDPAIAEAVHESIRSQEPRLLSSWHEAFLHFLWHPGVKSVAESVLYQPEVPLSAIIAGAAQVPALQERVLKEAQCIDVPLRRSIWAELSAIGAACAEAERWLARYDEETDATAKTTAALGYYRSATQDEPARAAALTRLQNDVAAVGPTHEARRQAAFAAAIALGEPGVLLSARMTISPDRPVRVPLRAGHRDRNAPFLQVVARALDALWEQYGPDLWCRLQAEHLLDEGQEQHLFYSDRAFDGLLVHGAGSQALERWLSEKIERYADRRGSREVLSFLDRTQPGSKLHLDYCIGTLEPGPRNAYHLGIQAYAAELLAHRAGGDPLVAARLLLPPRAGVELPFLMDDRPARIYALTLGWCEHEALGELRRVVQKRSEDYSFGSMVVRLAKSTAAETTDLLRGLFEDGSGFYPEAGRALRTILARRLEQDEQLGKSLVGLLSCSPSHMVSLAPLVQSLPQSLLSNEILPREIERQLTLASPEIGLDLFSGNAVSVLGQLGSLVYRAEASSIGAN